MKEPLLNFLIDMFTVMLTIIKILAILAPVVLIIGLVWYHLTKE